MKCLVLVGERKLAKNVQKTLADLLTRMKSDSTSIWPPATESGDSGEIRFGPEATTAQIVDQKQTEQKYQIPWNVLGKIWSDPPKLFRLLFFCYRLNILAVN